MGQRAFLSAREAILSKLNTRCEASLLLCVPFCCEYTEMPAQVQDNPCIIHQAKLSRCAVTPAPPTAGLCFWRHDIGHSGICLQHPSLPCSMTRAVCLLSPGPVQQVPHSSFVAVWTSLTSGLQGLFLLHSSYFKAEIEFTFTT